MTHDNVLLNLQTVQFIIFNHRATKIMMITKAITLQIDGYDYFWFTFEKNMPTPDHNASQLVTFSSLNNLLQLLLDLRAPNFAC